MTKTANLKKIVAKNPELDSDSLKRVQKIAEQTRKFRVAPPGYRLATPMTPRHLPPVDYNNRLLRAEKGISQNMLR